MILHTHPVALQKQFFTAKETNPDYEGLRIHNMLAREHNTNDSMLSESPCRLHIKESIQCSSFGINGILVVPTLLLTSEALLLLICLVHAHQMLTSHLAAQLERR